MIQSDQQRLPPSRRSQILFAAKTDMVAMGVGYYGARNGEPWIYEKVT
jgi:hypothetical protein